MKDLSAAEFVKAYMYAWHKDATYEEMAEALDTDTSTLGSRVGRYRIKGVKLPLPKRRGASRQIVPEELNSIVDQYRDKLQ